MSCKKNLATIIQGEEIDLPISFVKSDGVTPYPLNAPDEITVKFKDKNGALITKTLTASQVTITSDPAGTATVKLLEADTNLLPVKEFQDFSAEIVKGSVTRKALFVRGLTVKSDIVAS